MFINPLALLAALLLAATALLASPLATPAQQPKNRRWSSFSASTIHPGVQTVTRGGCTANFVFRRGDAVFLGQAAHCASLGGPGQTTGCNTTTLSEGTSVNITGAGALGTLAYSSWVRMQRRSEQNREACAYNDFALVHIDPTDVWRVNPSMPRFGGPTGVRQQGLVANETLVYGYGNSTLRRGQSWLEPKFGRSVREQGDGWSHAVRTVPPGIPGDSGSGYIDREGRAFGVLATLETQTGVNGVNDLRRLIEYARSFEDFAGLELVEGTERFNVALAAIGEEMV